MISWAVFDENNQPLSSLPIGPGGVEFIDYIDEDLVSRPQPIIQNLGGGVYGFEAPNEDLQDGVAYLVKNGTGFPAYTSGVVTTPASPVTAWALFDADGNLWTGGPSTIASYIGPTPAPTIQAVRPHLMLIRPSLALLATGDMQILAASPAGAEPAFVHESFGLGLMPTPVAPAIPATAAPDACSNMVGDLSDVIEMLASGCYVVTRKGVTARVNGRRSAPVTTTFEIIASVQPASGRDTDRLPEGLRSREAMTVYTKTELRPAQPEVGTEADRISIDGATFEVGAVRRWNRLANFYNATVVRTLA